MRLAAPDFSPNVPATSLALAVTSEGLQVTYHADPATSGYTIVAVATLVVLRRHMLPAGLDQAFKPDSQQGYQGAKHHEGKVAIPFEHRTFSNSLVFQEGYVDYTINTYFLQFSVRIVFVNDQILLIDKPAGMTSFGVVARVRRVLSEKGGKKVKVGHTGTLDPFATGLMILVTGKECKNAEKYSKLDKVYEATLRLGQTSTTGDPEGEITEVSSTQPSKEEIEAALRQFTGEITQRPPIFSAIKINGQRAYKLARDGKEVEIPLRKVTVYSLELLDYAYPEVKIRTHVSSGTYIRSLAEDIGAVLKTGAYCIQLRRTSTANWQVSNASSLEDLGIVS